MSDNLSFAHVRAKVRAATCPGLNFWEKSCNGKAFVLRTIGVHAWLAELIWDKYCQPMAISIFQKRTKETRFNITIRCLRLREEKEDGSAVLEWDGGNILVPYCSVEKEIIPHSMDGRGYYVVDVETYQEVTADDEGSVYGDEEEEGTVVEA